MTVPPPSLAVPPAWYGKLPARADFIGRRLPRPTVEAWDRWLQVCLGHSREVLSAAWQERYLTAPPWRLALPAGACGEAALAGVMVPSVDAVGRCFPFLVARELPAAIDPVNVAADGHAWFEAAEELALDALGDVFDLAAFDRSLPPVIAGAAGVPPQASSPPAPVGRWIDLPALAALPRVLRNAPLPWNRPALWWTGGGAAFQPALAITAGLIAPRGFTALLERNAMRHGWEAASGASPAEETDLAWDREG